MEKDTDPCNALKFNGKKDERAFDTSEGVIVCRKDPTEQKYRTLALMDKDDQEPLAINYGFLNKLKKSEKKS